MADYIYMLESRLSPSQLKAVSLVQGAINQRVNPLVLLRGQQLTLNFPVEAAGGRLQAQAKDVREEVKDGKLRLYVTYDFKGAKGGGQ